MSFSVHVAGDGAGWAIDEEAEHLRNTLSRLGVAQVPSRWTPSSAIYHCDRYRALKSLALGEKLLHRKVALAYFHGNPRNSLQFGKLLERMKRFRSMIDRVRVSTVEMESLLGAEGFDGKVQRIPIGVDVTRFSKVSAESRFTARNRLSVARDTVLIGSFQKDGEGWGEGFAPKPVKGPDLLVQTLRVISETIPNLLVLLVGPSRGYVERELTAFGIPFLRLPAVPREEMPGLYHALDLYIISSREEGGPKAFLEALATGIPLASTPVGQVVDLSNANVAAMTSSYDPDELADASIVLLGQENTSATVQSRRRFAMLHSLENQESDWKEFFTHLLGRTL